MFVSHFKLHSLSAVQAVQCAGRLDTFFARIRFQVTRRVGAFVQILSQVLPWTEFQHLYCRRACIADAFENNFQKSRYG